MGEAKRRQQSGNSNSAPKSSSKKGLFLGVAVILILAILAGLYVLTSTPSPDSESLPDAPADAAPFPAELDQVGISLGSPDAPVVVREFADYQCPACQRFSGAAKQLKEKYVESGKVRFVYFDLPLNQHENAFPAAQAARCAGDQDAYWAMHDKLFDAQLEWSGSNDPVRTFTRYAVDLALNERRFQRCMETELHREAVEQSRQVAVQLRLASTPTVFVDNIMLTRPGWAQMSAVVERELAESAQE